MFMSVSLMLTVYFSACSPFGSVTIFGRDLSPQASDPAHHNPVVGRWSRLESIYN